MNKLKTLDLSWNQLRNIREDISILRKHVPVLEILDLRHNRWQKVSFMESYVSAYYVLVVCIVFFKSDFNVSVIGGRFEVEGYWKD